MKTNRWIFNLPADLFFVAGPTFIVLILISIFSSYFKVHTEVNTLWWLILVLGIDVSHVYSSIFRTYLDKSTFQKHKSFLIITPIIVFVISTLVFSLGSHIFWRLMAYFAVYHFVKQQYGFLRIYQNKDQRSDWFKYYEQILIYVLTIVPVIYWHFNTDKQFSWFVENDFLNLSIISNTWIVIYILYLLVITGYIFIEIYFLIICKTVNYGKNLLLLSTGISWYLGIVYFNSDLIFTLFNVTTHGIPYIALVWFYQYKKQLNENPNWLKVVFNFKGIIIYVLILLGLSFFEEALWDILVWKDHLEVFGNINVDVQKFLLNLIVPLLSVPQITHYFIDGYIWKIKEDKFEWKELVGI